MLLEKQNLFCVASISYYELQSVCLIISISDRDNTTWVLHPIPNTWIYINSSNQLEPFRKKKAGAQEFMHFTLTAKLD